MSLQVLKNFTSINRRLIYSILNNLTEGSPSLRPNAEILHFEVTRETWIATVYRSRPKLWLQGRSVAGLLANFADFNGCRGFESGTAKYELAICQQLKQSNLMVIFDNHSAYKRMFYINLVKIALQIDEHTNPVYILGIFMTLFIKIYSTLRNIKR